MNVIAKKERYLIRPYKNSGSLNSYQMRFRFLSQKLKNENLIRIFAEPILASNYILWKSDLKGEVTKYTELDNKNKIKVQLDLAKKIEAIKKTSKEDDKFLELVDLYTFIPSENDIYIINDKDVILTQWGTESDDPDIEPFRIRTINELEVGIEIKTINANGNVYGKADVFVEINNEEISIKTNKNGLAEVGDYVYNQKFSIYTKKNGKKANIQNYKNQGLDIYEYIMPIIVSESFIIKNELNQVLSGQKINFIYNGKNIQHKSNSAGIITINNLDEGQEIQVYLSDDEDFESVVVKVKASENDTLHEIILQKKTTKEVKQPVKNCRAFFTGATVGDTFVKGRTSKIYVEDDYSEYVGAGEYPDNELAFPKAVKFTFDGIAIDRGTRVIIYEKKNFQGKILLDKVGPAIINNIRWKENKGHKHLNTMEYSDQELQKNFPQNVRIWSETDMHSWSYGSLKVICEKNKIKQ